MVLLTCADSEAGLRFYGGTIELAAMAPSFTNGCLALRSVRTESSQAIGVLPNLLGRRYHPKEELKVYNEASSRCQLM